MDDGETMVGNPLKTCEQTIGGSAEENNIQNMGRYPPTKVVETTGVRHEKDNVQPMDKNPQRKSRQTTQAQPEEDSLQPGNGRGHDYGSPTGGKRRYISPASLSPATNKRPVHAEE